MKPGGIPPTSLDDAEAQGRFGVHLSRVPPARKQLKACTPTARLGTAQSWTELSATRRSSRKWHRNSAGASGRVVDGPNLPSSSISWPRPVQRFAGPLRRLGGGWPPPGGKLVNRFRPAGLPFTSRQNRDLLQRPGRPATGRGPPPWPHPYDKAGPIQG